MFANPSTTTTAIGIDDHISRTVMMIKSERFFSK
jgi:hypothetical protein